MHLSHISLNLEDQEMTNEVNAFYIKIKNAEFMLLYKFFVFLTPDNLMHFLLHFADGT
jgi:hypothetical protein